MPEGLTYRNQANYEVAIISADSSLNADAVRIFRAQNVFPQLLHPEAPASPTLRRNADKIITVYLGPDVPGHKNYNEIMGACRDLCLNVVHMTGQFSAQPALT